MFNDVIRETPFTTEAASTYFTNIGGDWWNGDVTFISTMRALLGGRMGEDDKVTLRFRRASYNKDYLESYSKKDQVDLAVGDAVAYKDHLFIVNLCHSDTATNDAWIESMKENLPKVYPDFTYLEKVTVFFRKICSTACFVNAKTKTTVFFISQLTARRMHYIQSATLAYFPWYHGAGQGITAEERELMESCRLKTSEAYLTALGKIAAGFDFEAARVRKLLAGFETKFDRLRLDQTNRNIDTIRRAIEDLNRQIGERLRQMHDSEIMALGLDAKIKSGECSNDLMDYFLANKKLVLRSVDDSTMEFVVKAQLDFFDEEQARKYINRDDSYFYDYLRRGDGFTRENVKMLMTEIFLTQRLKVNMCAAYRFDLHGSVEGLKNYEYYGAECAEYTPNPHIDAYRCLGNYVSLINQCLENHDYIGAVEQSIASCKSLNLGDGAVMGKFVDRFCGNATVNMRCVVLPNGNVVTPKDAIKWLNDEKAAKEAAAAAAAAPVETPTEEPAEE